MPQQRARGLTGRYRRILPQVRFILIVRKQRRYDYSAAVNRRPSKSVVPKFPSSSARRIVLLRRWAFARETVYSCPINRATSTSLIHKAPMGFPCGADQSVPGVHSARVHNGRFGEASEKRDSLSAQGRGIAARSLFPPLNGPQKLFTVRSFTRSFVSKPNEPQRGAESSRGSLLRRELSEIPSRSALCSAERGESRPRDSAAR